MRELPWRVVLIALAAGLLIGLGYAWFVNPVSYVDIAPDQLSAADQREYLLLIAQTYARDGDLEQAQARLSWLGVADVTDWVETRTDEALLRGADQRDVDALAGLAAALGGAPMAAEGVSEGSGPSEAGTPLSGGDASGNDTSVPAPLPADAPIPTLALPALGVTDAAFELIGQETVCDNPALAGVVAVEVVDAAGGGIPGVEVIVAWPGGEDHFFTGLKAEHGRGYGDFTLMSEGQTVSVALAGRSEAVSGVGAEGCEGGSAGYWLTFGPIN